MCRSKFHPAPPPPPRPCRTCRPSTARGVARQGVALRGGVAVTLASVAPHCATMNKGWQTAGIRARRSFPCRRFRPLFSAPLALCPKRRGTQFWVEHWPGPILMGRRLRTLKRQSCSSRQISLLNSHAQDFHFLLQNPRVSEGYQKGSLKGF